MFLAGGGVVKQTRMAAIGLLTACVGPVGPEDADSSGDSDVAPDSAETGDVTAPPMQCPSDMKPVPVEDPVYCIDTYEVSGDGSYQSVAGAIPTTAITFLEARTACEATPVLSDMGEVMGYKHLATDAEWEDAADGVYGVGGQSFPYGENAEEGVCVLPNSEGVPVVYDLQLTGSAPDCVSPFGVYDQIGNAWEWVDPLQDNDREAWFAYATAAGHGIDLNEEGQVRSTDGDLSWIAYRGVVFGSLPPQVDADGLVTLDATGLDLRSDTFLKGYLVNNDPGANLAETYLAVTLTLDEANVVRFTSDDASEGLPFTSKRGCAFYAGTAEQCPAAYISHEHPPDFDGTIGMRCAAAPF